MLLRSFTPHTPSLPLTTIQEKEKIPGRSCLVPYDLEPPQVISEHMAVEAMNVLIHVLRKHSITHRIVLVTEVEFHVIEGTSVVATLHKFCNATSTWQRDLREEPAHPVRFDDDAAGLAVHVGEQVVQVDAPRVGRDGDGVALVVLVIVEGSAAAVVETAGCVATLKDLRRKSERRC